jgi:hypothetical protein
MAGALAKRGITDVLPRGIPVETPSFSAQGGLK